MAVESPPIVFEAISTRWEEEISCSFWPSHFNQTLIKGELTTSTIATQTIQVHCYSSQLATLPLCQCIFTDAAFASKKYEKLIKHCCFLLLSFLISELSITGLIIYQFTKIKQLLICFILFKTPSLR